MVTRTVLFTICAVVLCAAPVRAHMQVAQSSPPVSVTLPPPATVRVVPAQPAAPPQPAQPVPAAVAPTPPPVQAPAPVQPAAPVQSAGPTPGPDGLYANMDTSGNQPFAWFDLPGADPLLCQDACRKEAKCKAFTYTAPGKYNHPNPRCWLKDSPGTLTPNANVTSGFIR